MRILAINPGSTSTKIAVFQNEEPIFIKNIKHKIEELSKFEKITDQFQFRKHIIIRELDNADVTEDHVKAVVGRGGLVRPIESGVYMVNDKMKHDLQNSPLGEHASNLGGLIADDIAQSLPDCKAYITNPVVVDELDDIARISGHPRFKRLSIFHALNQKAVAHEHAKSILKKYEDLNLIVVHLGGGITVGAHRKGRVIDVNQGLDGEGPFSPERSGTLPVGDLVRLCFSGEFSQKEIMKMIKGEGGMVAYLKTNNAYEVEKRVEKGDKEAEMIYDAMSYQVSKAIGGMAAVLNGEVDGILITGGIAHDKWFVNRIVERVHRFGPVHIYPGEDEMRALAMNVLRVIKGEIQPKTY
ncbi:MAG: butyrate kinase [Bacteroidales bacterium]|nr:butyrate kinase [Bacteroidales bacterium]MCF8344568.1 butyrate kinase [Bacteroidales bacterium]MCF8350337.1 butyrate kinase [Bacteroidales bacterium]MCF8376469.1 butyrate kinase [Bacteroidales bacterium]